jgi:S-adenosylmethionine hydrolase
VPLTVARPFITFLTDFGLQDDFVGTCHGVIKRIAPEVEIIDITHGIPPQAVLQGALVLAQTLPYMPAGVHPHLALGVPLEELGPPLATETLVRLDLPEPRTGRERLDATVLYVDRFGNMQLNLTRDHLERVDVLPGRRVELELGAERYYAVAARTFADARPGDIILFEDAYRNVAIAISGGNAAQMFGAGPGDDVRIRLEFE